MAPLIFISYRRRDSSAVSRWLADEISETYGTHSVFIDVDTIRIGDDWTKRIDNALSAASVLIVVIGPMWLRISDDAGRRLLDQPSDWVRKEILYAIKNKKTVIPLVISKAELPKQSSLPSYIKQLTDFQSFELRDEHWHRDLKSLFYRFDEIGFKRIGQIMTWPFPVINLKVLADNEIKEFINKNTNWALVSSKIPGKEPDTTIELTKTFKFHSFEDAMDFMSNASQYISKVNHQPRWQNIWKSVTVWLTTWDIGFRPSLLDIELAEHFEKLHLNYLQPVLVKVDEKGNVIWKKDDPA